MSMACIFTSLVDGDLQKQLLAKNNNTKLGNYVVYTLFHENHVVKIFHEIHVVKIFMKFVMSKIGFAGLVIIIIKTGTVFIGE
jgi:hypothetical protein